MDLALSEVIKLCWHFQIYNQDIDNVCCFMNEFCLICLYLDIYEGPLLHLLFLDHDIIFYFQTTLKIFKKILSYFFFNTFENFMGNGASIFYNIFKYMILQRHQKALLWSKRLNLIVS